MKNNRVFSVYTPAKTAYGIIGIKVWIFKGEVMEHDPAARDRRQAELQESGAGRPAGGRPPGGRPPGGRPGGRPQR